MKPRPTSEAGSGKPYLGWNNGSQALREGRQLGAVDAIGAVGWWGGGGDACSQEECRSPPDLLEHIYSCLQDTLLQSKLAAAHTQAGSQSSV